MLDFPEVLTRTLMLLSHMDEFSRSRYKLEARYQHVLVDEFQDTSRAQWALVELLVRSWSEGLGLVDSDRQPTVFIVGDRKQSIYGFRDAEVAVLDEAARYIEALRPQGQVRTAITHSFRSVRELLAFANDLFGTIDKAPERSDAFRYGDDDRFPLASVEATESEPLGADRGARLTRRRPKQRPRRSHVCSRAVPRSAIGRRVFAGPSGRATSAFCSERVRATACSRMRSPAAACPFTSTKGLGFFDADEIKDVLALLGFLANPASELRAAAFLRSRFIRVSDTALKLLAPELAAALTAPDASGSNRAPRRRRSPSTRARPLGDAAVASAGRQPAAGGAARPSVGRVGIRRGDQQPRLSTSARESQENPLARAPAAEPRLRHPRSHRRRTLPNSWPAATSPMPSSMRSTPSTS